MSSLRPVVIRIARPFFALAIAVVLLLGFAACSNNATSQPSAGTQEKPIKIGTTEAAEAYWQVFKNKAQQQGIFVELINFGDYNQPNPALTQGQLDLNQFQHLIYLADYNKKSSATLTPIGATAVYPLPLYSKKYQTLAELPPNAKVVIPNDPTNQARSLLVLKAAGLLDLANGGSPYSTPADIINPKVEVTAIDASQTAAQINSVDAAIVNNNYATAANLSGTEDVLFADDVNSDEFKPYINVFVSRAADKDNPTFRKLVEIYHDPEVIEAVRADLGTSGVIKDNDPADLQQTLQSLQNQES